MKDIIIAYPNKNVAMTLRALLDSEGFHVSHICALGSSLLQIASAKSEGVIITASILKDMGVGAISDNLPPNFDIIALSRNGKSEYMGNMITMATPLDRDEFINTVSVLVASKSSFTNRRHEDSNIISDAKLILINRDNMTELQAHRYLQKESMRTGLKITDIAEKICNDFT